MDIEEWIGRPCRHLCYPNGSVDSSISEMARRCGYVSGVTTEEGLNRTGDDPMRLRRIGPPAGSDAIEILAVVSGLSAAVANLKRQLLQPLEQIARRWHTWRESQDAGEP
jgi:hypothetical protein